MIYTNKEICDVVSVALQSNAEMVTWKRMAQWNIEKRLGKLSESRAVLYNSLHMLNTMENSMNNAGRSFPDKLRPERLTGAINEFIGKERTAGRTLITEINQEIRKLKVAYTVVTNSYQLPSGLFVSEENEIPAILRNAHGRWHYTPSMFMSYVGMLDRMKTMSEDFRSKSKELYDRNMVKFPVEDGFETYSIYGKAIVYAGHTEGNQPVLLSMNCSFNLKGHIEGLPDDFVVLMFKPRTTTVTRKWVNPSNGEEAKVPPGLVPSKESGMILL